MDEELTPISSPTGTSLSKTPLSIRITPVRAEVERIERITVCTRPFRAQGPRIEAERLGQKLLVHNYGHGGSGWSLSWGSASIVVPIALSEGAREVAVIGCGALGITAAISLQRAGAKVTIYARELPPNVRSSRATGTWTPDARVALANAAPEEFASRWEQMARFSFAEYQRSLDLPHRPIQFHHRYVLSDLEPDAAASKRFSEDPIGFIHLEHLLSDLSPAPLDLGPGMHPFPTAFCRRTTLFRFNLAEYSRHLIAEFLSHGGAIRMAEFHSPGDLAALPEGVVVNCTGYGARALFGDESLTPVRGQIAWLPAQPELTYSLQWENLNVVSRADGLVVQLGGGGDPSGWNDPSEDPDQAEAEQAIRLLASLQAGMIERA